MDLAVPVGQVVVRLVFPIRQEARLQLRPSKETTVHPVRQVLFRMAVTAAADGEASVAWLTRAARARPTAALVGLGRMLCRRGWELREQPLGPSVLAETVERRTPRYAPWVRVAPHTQVRVATAHPESRTAARFLLVVPVDLDLLWCVS